MASNSPGCSDPGYSSCLSRGRECFLCGAKYTQMMQYGSTSSEVKSFLMQHYDGIILEDSWICKKHILEAQRNSSASGYVPKWCKLSKPQSKGKCANTSCNCASLEHQKLIKPTFASINEINMVFQIKVDTDNSFVLCHLCYCQAYNLLNPKKTCKSCGAI